MHAAVYRHARPSTLKRPHPSADTTSVWPPTRTARSIRSGSSRSARSTRPISRRPASSCASAACSPSSLDELPGERRGGVAHRLQEDQAEVAADLLAPVRDDDRGGPERRQRARDPRAADRRQVPRRRDQGAPRRRRGRPAALAGDGAPPEGLQPPLRLDGRGRRGGRHPRHGARPRRLPDREGDADQAPRQGRDDLPDDGADLRDPRPDRHADVPRAGLREDLRPARRRPADADAVRRRHAPTCSRHNWFIIFPALARLVFGVRKREEDRAGPPDLGPASS